MPQDLPEIFYVSQLLQVSLLNISVNMPSTYQLRHLEVHTGKAVVEPHIPLEMHPVIEAIPGGLDVLRINGEEYTGHLLSISSLRCFAPEQAKHCTGYWAFHGFKHLGVMPQREVQVLEKELYDLEGLVEGEESSNGVHFERREAVFGVVVGGGGGIGRLSLSGRMILTLWAANSCTYLPLLLSFTF